MVFIKNCDCSKRVCKHYWKEYNKLRPGHSMKGMHNKRFGGLRDEVLKRDNYQCIICKMTNKEHRELWKRDLTIDHKDGNGRYSDMKNNSINNLQTLCLRCHGRKDSLRYWHERSVDNQKL